MTKPKTPTPPTPKPPAMPKASPVAAAPPPPPQPPAPPEPPAPPSSMADTHAQLDELLGGAVSAPAVAPEPPVLEPADKPAEAEEPPAPEFKPTVVLEPGQQLPPELAGFPAPPPLPDLPREPEEPAATEMLAPPSPAYVAPAATTHLPVDPIAAERTRVELEAGRAALIAAGHNPDAPRPALNVTEPEKPAPLPAGPTNFSGRIPQSTLDEQAAGRAVIQRKREERELVQEQERRRRATAAEAGAPASKSDLDYRE